MDLYRSILSRASKRLCFPTQCCTCLPRKILWGHVEIGLEGEALWRRWYVLGKVGRGRFSLWGSEKALWRWGLCRIRSSPGRERKSLWGHAGSSWHFNPKRSFAGEEKSCLPEEVPCSLTYKRKEQETIWWELSHDGIWIPWKSRGIVITVIIAALAYEEPVCARHRVTIAHAFFKTHWIFIPPFCTRHNYFQSADENTEDQRWQVACERCITRKWQSQGSMKACDSRVPSHLLESLLPSAELSRALGRCHGRGRDYSWLQMRVRKLVDFFQRRYKEYSTTGKTFAK